MRRFWYALVIGLSVLVYGCDQSPSGKNSPAPQPNAPAATNPYVSAEGEFITLKADNLTQHQIITFMSTQLGFEVKLTPSLDKTISVNVVNVTLREALKTVLSGNPYSVTLLYESQVDNLPKSVIITAGGNSTSLEPQPVAPQQNGVRSASSPVSVHPAPVDNKQVMKQIQDKILPNNPPPAADEPDFLEGMTGTKEDAEKVMPMLKDPNASAEDKEAIINMLQEGEHDDVIDPLSTALRDKNPDVVKAAIDAIVFLGNENDVEMLKKLRDSTKNEDIRQAADDGVTFLE